jgi:hypothetical protein
MKLNGQQLKYFNRGCQGEIISILKLDAFCRFLKKEPRQRVISRGSIQLNSCLVNCTDYFIYPQPTPACSSVRLPSPILQC